MYTSKEGGDQAAAAKEGSQVQTSLVKPTTRGSALADLIMNIAIPQHPISWVYRRIYQLAFNMQCSLY